MAASKKYDTEKTEIKGLQQIEKSYFHNMGRNLKEIKERPIEKEGKTVATCFTLRFDYKTEKKEFHRTARLYVANPADVPQVREALNLAKELASAKSNLGINILGTSITTKFQPKDENGKPIVKEDGKPLTSTATVIDVKEMKLAQYGENKEVITSTTVVSKDLEKYTPGRQNFWMDKCKITSKPDQLQPSKTEDGKFEYHFNVEQKFGKKDENGKMQSRKLYVNFISPVELNLSQYMNLEFFGYIQNGFNKDKEHKKTICPVQMNEVKFIEKKKEAVKEVSLADLSAEKTPATPSAQELDLKSFATKVQSEPIPEKVVVEADPFEAIDASDVGDFQTEPEEEDIFR